MAVMIKTQLDRYIFKTALTPTAITLLIAALLLILEQMLRLLDFVLNENGPVDVVWRMLAYLVPNYLSLALPLSAFLGVVLAVRKLSLSSEHDALLSSGLSPTRILRPLFLLSGIMMLLNLLLLAYIQPYARYNLNLLHYELQAGLLGARIPVGQFVEVADGVRVRIAKTEAGGSRLYDLFVRYQNDTSGDWSTFTAKEGRFLRSTDSNRLILRLYEGRQMIVRGSEKQPGVLTFKQQDLSINLPDVPGFRGRGGEKREATLGELISVINGSTPVNPDLFGSYRASFHYRIIHTLTFLALPFLGGALGLVNKRRPTQAGPILGLVSVIIYHEALEEWGEYQVSAGLLSPYLSMWPIFIIFFLFSYHLFHRSSELPGRQSLWIIDTAWVSVQATSSGLLKKLRVSSRTPNEGAES